MKCKYHPEIVVLCILLIIIHVNIVKTNKFLACLLSQLKLVLYICIVIVFYMII